MNNFSQDAHDTLERFLSECCEISADSRITKSSFYSAYHAFAESVGLTPLSASECGRELKTQFFIEEGRTKQARFWKIRLKEANEQQFPETSCLSSNEEVLLHFQPVFHQATESNLHSPNAAVEELIYRNMMGVWERRKI